MPEVSVIIPNYNQSRFVTAAIDSVLQQSFRDVEIIVVDDGSTDDSAAVIARYGDRVRYIYQQNQGLGAARNTGIKAATGRFVGLLDADDAWLPTYLAHMMTLATRHPDAAVYYANARHGRQRRGDAWPRHRRAGRPDQVYAQLLRANFLIPSTILLRRDVVMAAGLFEQHDQAMHGCEDWDLWLRLAPHHRFVGAYTPLVRYRVHGGSLSAGVDKMQRGCRAVVESTSAWTRATLPPGPRPNGVPTAASIATLRSRRCSAKEIGDAAVPAIWPGRWPSTRRWPWTLDSFYDLASGHTAAWCPRHAARPGPARQPGARARALLTRLLRAADAVGGPPGWRVLTGHGLVCAGPCCLQPRRLWGEPPGVSASR
ncbi:MAG: glycosyltransferase [Caldilineaceae bacterium]|nr:glycosyltransferase [Caldilineaceae bacterium]